jgi:hypothetical protein
VTQLTSLRLTTTITCRGADRVLRCSVCNAAIDERQRIAPEAATQFVQLCGRRCHEAWRSALPVVERLAARGRDLSVGE